jgi:hypothetical protein
MKKSVSLLSVLAITLMPCASYAVNLKPNGAVGLDMAPASQSNYSLSIQSAVPVQTAVGGQLKIFGKGFIQRPDLKVFFTGVSGKIDQPAQVSSKNDSTVDVIVPNGAKTGRINVVVGTGTIAKSAISNFSIIITSSTNASFDLRMGKIEWEVKCRLCHGIDGKGQTVKGSQMKIADFTSPAWQASFTDDSIRRSIEMGVDREKMGVKQHMEAYTGKISPEHIAVTVAYIRTLRK